MAIVMTPADRLKVGDVFSTDGYVVRSVDASHGAVITIVAALGAHVKYARRSPDALLPIYVADDRPRNPCNPGPGEGELRSEIERCEIATEDGEYEYSEAEGIVFDRDERLMVGAEEAREMAGGVSSLVRLERSARSKRRADGEWRAAVLAALAAGEGYAAVARAGGVSRQAVRQLALREGEKT